MSDAKTLAAAPANRLSPNRAVLTLYRRLGARNRRAPAPRDLSYEVWLRNHGHGEPGTRKQSTSSSDRQKVLWRWTRRFIFKRRRTFGTAGANPGESALAVWRMHHSGGDTQSLRPTPIHQTPPTRRHLRHRRFFTQELADLGSEESSMPAVPRVPLSAVGTRRRGAATRPGRRAAKEATPTTRQRGSGWLRLIRFAFRSLRRLKTSRARALPSVEPKPAPAPQPSDPLESEVQTVLSALLRDGGTATRHSGELQRSVRKLLEIDGNATGEQGAPARDPQVDLLEGKIRRLAGLLERSEKERKKLISAQEEAVREHQPTSRRTAPRKDKDPNRKMMLGMMLQIREINRQIRTDIDDLESRSGEIPNQPANPERDGKGPQG